jgi:hypothetical protein
MAQRTGRGHPLKPSHQQALYVAAVAALLAALAIAITRP